jgi:phosphatidylglycerol:prolipoprotein diacylglycerol transferase
MTWNIDPEILRIGPFALRYYSLMFVIGFIIMGEYVKYLFKRSGKNPEDVSSLTTYIITGMLIGARLGHCLFYDPIYYWNHPLEVLFIWEGGLASHGGYFGVLVAAYFFLRKNPSYNFLNLMDILSAPSLFVGGLIRLGNFMNSEIYGKPTDLPWAIIFEKVDKVPRHPSQLYEAAGYLLIAGVLFYLQKKFLDQWRPGKILSIAIILSFFFRFLVEFTKGEQSTLLENPDINVGQWLSIVFIVFGVGLLLHVNRSDSG